MTSAPLAVAPSTESVCPLPISKQGFWKVQRVCCRLSVARDVPIRVRRGHILLRQESAAGVPIILLVENENRFLFRPEGSTKILTVQIRCSTDHNMFRTDSPQRYEESGEGLRYYWYCATDGHDMMGQINTHGGLF